MGSENVTRRACRGQRLLKEITWRAKDFFAAVPAVQPSAQLFVEDRANGSDRGTGQPRSDDVGCPMPIAIDAIHSGDDREHRQRNGTATNDPLTRQHIQHRQHLGRQPRGVSAGEAWFVGPWRTLLRQKFGEHAAGRHRGERRDRDRQPRSRTATPHCERDCDRHRDGERGSAQSDEDIRDRVESIIAECAEKAANPSIVTGGGLVANVQSNARETGRARQPNQREGPTSYKP